MRNGISQRVRQSVYDALLRTGRVQESRGLAGRAWRFTRNATSRRWERVEVRTKLHGRVASINFANPYPFFIQRFPTYNAPQVELVAAISKAAGRPVHVVDVGAAVGDTAMLLLEWCGAQIDRLDCIEGDPEFVRLLSQNLPFPNVHIHSAVLSARNESIPSLVRTQHQGTASAEGADTRRATTLDDLLAGTHPDVIKVDTDGFDGQILAGAREILSTSRPAVIFEWHPLLCRRVGTDDRLGFDVLEAAGYDRFVFFDKYGEFSHFGLEGLDDLRRLCLTGTTRFDWHYDVVALHPASGVDEVDLADLRYWAARS
jgi:FkbM family methyltransferase